MSQDSPFTFKKTKFSQARIGLLKTAHGQVFTPAYVIVATQGFVRTLSPADLKKTKTQIVIANTYHLWQTRGSNIVRRRLKLKLPTMTDSGGFQVFSLGAAKEHGVGKVLRQPVKLTGFSQVRISEKGVSFKVDGQRLFISPETSIATQERLGADIIFAFDECTSPLHSLAYQKKSLGLTQRWAQRSLDAHHSQQLIFGIIQGGRFKSLRTKSAKLIGALPFDGFGIGGSFGKDEMRQTLSWVVPHLPAEKPRHLLGIGAVRDIFEAVEAGVDLMDCVIPTREGRHARLYTDQGVIDVRKIKYATSSWAKLHRLFKAHDLKAGRLATIHNVSWFNQLMSRIRHSLKDSSYLKLKKSILKYY